MRLNFLLILVLGTVLIGCSAQEALPEASIIENIAEDAFEELPEASLPAPEPELQATIIINEGFEPTTLVIDAGKEVTWEVQDDKRHLIACYALGKRIVNGKVIEQGESFTHKFDLRGEVLCIDSIYGYRGQIMIKPAVINEVTGRVVAVGFSGKPPLGITVLLLGMLITLIQIIAFYKK